MIKTPLREQEVVYGIDPSLAHTGACRIVAGKVTDTVTMDTEPDKRYPARLEDLRYRMRLFLLPHPTLVAMESEIFMAASVQATQSSGTQAILQHLIWTLDARPRFLSVNVAHVKKWIGAKEKNQILLQVYKAYGVEFSDDNLADAYVIADIGVSFLRFERGEVHGFTKPRLEVLEKLRKSGLVWEAPAEKPRRTRKARL